MNIVRQVFSEDFKEGLQFKDYPEAVQVYEMKSVERQEEQDLVIVQFSRVGGAETFSWTGRLGINGNNKASVWAVVELEPWQKSAIEFFKSHSSAEISTEIKGITTAACDRVLARQPLTWDSFIEAKLTDNQIQALETYFKQ